MELVQKSSYERWNVMEDVLEITNQAVTQGSKCTVHGIRMFDQITSGETVFFTAVGDGLDNVTPMLEDVRWIPYSYQIGNYLRHFMFSFTESFCISRPGEYMFQLKFHKENYDGFNWMPTKEFSELTIPIVVN